TRPWRPFRKRCKPMYGTPGGDASAPNSKSCTPWRWPSAKRGTCRTPSAGSTGKTTAVAVEDATVPTLVVDADVAALSTAIKAVARAAKRGNSEEIWAAEQKFAAAVADFPKERQEGVREFGKRRIRAELYALNTGEAQDIAEREEQRM